MPKMMKIFDSMSGDILPQLFIFLVVSLVVLLLCYFISEKLKYKFKNNHMVEIIIYGIGLLIILLISDLFTVRDCVLITMGAIGLYIFYHWTFLNHTAKK